MKSSSKGEGGREAFRWRNVNTRMTSEKNFIREGWDVISTTLGMEIIRRVVEG